MKNSNISYIEDHAYITKDQYYVYIDNHYIHEFSRINDKFVRFHHGKINKKIRLKKLYKLEISNDEYDLIAHSYSKSTLKRKLRRFERNLKSY